MTTDFFLHPLRPIRRRHVALMRVLFFATPVFYSLQSLPHAAREAQASTPAIATPARAAC